MKKKDSKQFYRRLLHRRPIREALYRSKKVIIPGFQRVPLFDVAMFFVKGLMKGSLSQRAGAMSYRFLFSLLPTFITFFALLPYIPVSSLYDNIYAFIYEIVPIDYHSYVKETLDGILRKKHSGLLSVSIIASLYVASGGVNAIIKGFNRSQHSVEHRTWIKQRLVSLGLLLLIYILVVISFSLIIGYKTGLHFLIAKGIIPQALYPILIVGKWVVLIALTYFTFSILYYFAPANRSEYRFFSAGSSLATILFLVLTSGLRIYIERFANYNAIYGSLGLLIVLMLWIQMNSHTLLIGFELNASIVEATREKKASIRSLHPTEDDTV